MTALTVSTAPAASVPADCLVIGVAEGHRGPVLTPGAAGVAEAFGGTLAELLGTLGMTGAAGEAVKLPAPAGIGAGLLLAVGLGAAPAAAAVESAAPAAAVESAAAGGAAGNEQGYGAEALRRAAGVAARSLTGAGVVALALPAGTAEAVEAVATGGLLGAYAFTAYRTGDREAAPVRELAIVAGRAGRAVAEAAVRRAEVLGRELNRARDLVNTPANDLYPESFAALVRGAGREHDLTVEVLDEQALTTGGFGGLLGVGQGSVRPPRLVRIAHTHPGATASLAFVGKGITYDSGGISLKPVGANEIMKRDMSGAAAVFAAVLAVARLGLRINVTGWLALAENMPSGSAVRPGDVLRMYGGRTVEVLNTDAEGRLVLADALVRAGEERPDAIVDVATLTAAMRYGLGNHLFGVMSNDDALRDRVLAAAGRSGERAWPMPLPDELRRSLNSRVADLANYGERMGGGLVAGLFLREFVPSGVPWAHLDIAGPAFHEGEPYGYTPHGGTGCAVRTLVRLAEDTATGGHDGA